MEIEAVVALMGGVVIVFAIPAIFWLPIGARWRRHQKRN